MADILVIEDDDQFREFVLDALQELGYRAVAAPDGDAGLALLERYPQVSLVITDIFMPQRDGIETIMALRHVHPRLKVIAMSGGQRRVDMDFLPLADKLGAVQTLQKPFSLGEFSDAVAAALP